ncbi:MAG: RHS repeat-associated core domain-containing protein [Parvularculaceae bacterium]
MTLILFLLIWGALSIPDAFAATVTRQSSFTYDSVSGLLLSETVEPNDSAFTVTTSYTYDAFGNVTDATTAGTGIVSRTTSSTYEANGRFALTKTNALSHTESVVTDAKFGVATSQTGPNSLTTTWAYDSFGRPTQETRADGTKTVYAYEYCSGTAGGSATCPTYGTSAHGAYVITATPKDASNVQNGPWVKTYYDSHGRVMATDTQSFTATTIRQATEYDAYGRVARESRPYFLSGGTAVWTTYAYDALGRTTSITLPDTSASTFAYSGLTTSVTNDLSQTETTVKNVRGEIVSVTDANGKTTSFTYDPFGNRTSITDSAGNIATMTYDKAGRKIAAVDPDLGSWSYSYNVLGELVGQTDAKSQSASMTYDKLGRPLTRVEGGVTSSWVYDTATKGVGKLHTASTSLGYLKTLSYDSLGRPSSTATRSATGEPTETSSVVYDSDSRIDRIAYPSGFEVQYVYTALGYPSQLKEYGGAALWTANAMDQELRLLQSTAGNGVVTTRTFDQNRGYVTAIEAGTSNAVAAFMYAFDTIGNLTQRSDSNQSLVENFTYDVLNRLATYQIVGETAKTMTYDDLGNIASKSDVGSYSYPAAANYRPHAVTAAGSNSYAYDANGNMTSGAGRTLSWTSFNKVASITQGTTTVSWVYGPGRERVKQTSTAGDTFYYDDAASGAYFEKLVGSTVTQWSDYLFAGGEMVGVKFTRSDATEALRYFVTDHLGSVAVLTDESGAVAERLSYDAWGKRRYPDGTDDTANALTSQTTRGFTGHEMVDDIDLVNMNGRVYDPALGRFISADPFIHDVTNSQDLNRYSYVHNNPLSYTDMNGYGFFKKLAHFFKRIWKTLLAIAIVFVIQQYELLPTIIPGSSPAAVFLNGAITNGITGGIASVVVTGRPKAFLAGFGQAFATYGVGHGLFPGNPVTGKVKFGSGAHLGRIVGHGVIGGSFAEIHGGKFSAGFSAAAFTSAAGPVIPEDYWGGFAVSVAIGGTGSVIGGGKFEDGAVTAAFVYLFNETAGGKCTAARTSAAATCSAAGAAAAAGVTACALTTIGEIICGPVVVAASGAVCVSAAYSAAVACDNVVYNDSEDVEGKRRSSKPTDAPAGTKPIDKSGLGKEKIHEIKDGIGAGPKDYVGVTPDGTIIVTDPETGKAEDAGNVSDYD